MEKSKWTFLPTHYILDNFLDGNTYLSGYGSHLENLQHGSRASWQSHVLHFPLVSWLYQNHSSQVAIVIRNKLPNTGDLRDTGSILGLGRSPWSKAWQPTPVFLPGESQLTEEPGGLQSIGLQRAGLGWSNIERTCVNNGCNKINTRGGEQKIFEKSLKIIPWLYIFVIYFYKIMEGKRVQNEFKRDCMCYNGSGSLSLDRS